MKLKILQLVVIFNIEHAHSIMRAKFEKFSNKNQSLSLCGLLCCPRQGKKCAKARQLRAKVVSVDQECKSAKRIRSKSCKNCTSKSNISTAVFSTNICCCLFGYQYHHHFIVYENPFCTRCLKIIPKCLISKTRQIEYFWHFYELLSTKNVSLARFARSNE